MKRMRWSARLLVMLTGALAVAPSAAASTFGDDNKRVDRVVHSGSDTTYNLLSRLAHIYNESFGCETIAPSGVPQPLDGTCVPGTDTPQTITTENYDHDVVYGLYPIGSSAGINQLCAQGRKTDKPYPIHFARSSRAPRSSDCSGLRFVAYARDAIPWVHYVGSGSASAGVTNLTQQQLRDIFVNCTITNWSQVGGANAPIIVYAATKQSGTGPTFDQFLGGNAFNCIPPQYKDGNLANGERVIRENDVAPIMADGEEENAIFYSSFGRFNQNTPTDWEMGSIDGIAPTYANIQNAVFPYARFVYNVYRAATARLQATPSTLEFIHEKDGWLCKPAAQHAVNPTNGLNYRTMIEQVIDAEGFVTLPIGAIGGGVSGTSHCRALAITP